MSEPLPVDLRRLMGLCVCPPSLYDETCPSDACQEKQRALRAALLRASDPDAYWPASLWGEWREKR